MSRRAQNTKGNRSLTRSVRRHRVKKGEMDGHKWFRGWKEVRFELSHTGESYVESVQVSKKWNMEFPPTRSIVTPWFRHGIAVATRLRVCPAEVSSQM